MRSPERETELSDGDHMLVTKLGVTDPESVAAAFEAGRAKLGSIDAVVYNAGYGGNDLFEQFSDADAREMLETDVSGPVNAL
jgi:NAD(P)-dependent dehydrogenase (short-subunit alcohol dehydrogenase family)